MLNAPSSKIIISSYKRFGVEKLIMEINKAVYNINILYKQN